jgi:hypothetical protein
LRDQVVSLVVWFTRSALIQEHETLGILPIFWKDEEKFAAPAGQDDAAFFTGSKV